MRNILTTLTCLLFAWTLFSVIFLFSTDDSWITYGMHSGFSLYLAVIILCLTILLRAQNKIQLGVWLFGVLLLAIAFYLFFQPMAIVDYWNYALGGIVILIGYTLIHLVEGKRVMWLTVTPTVILLSLLFFMKFDYTWAFTFGTIFLALLSIIAISVILLRR